MWNYLFNNLKQSCFPVLLETFWNHVLRKSDMFIWLIKSTQIYLSWLVTHGKKLRNYTKGNNNTKTRSRFRHFSFSLILKKCWGLTRFEGGWSWTQSMFTRKTFILCYCYYSMLSKKLLCLPNNKCSEGKSTLSLKYSGGEVYKYKEWK